MNEPPVFYARERWAPIPDHPAYEVSHRGRIRKGRLIMRPQLVSGGMSIILNTGGVPSTLRVARLVGNAFSPECRKGLYPRYKNGDVRDCGVRNLKWVPRGAVTKAPFTKNPKVAV